MYFLKKYESVNIDNFNSFLKKYQKSGYISSISKDRLKDSGINAEIFSKLENKVKNVMNFIRDNDIETFFDYFQEVRDMYPHISEYLHFKVGVSPVSSKDSNKLDDFNILVSLDESGLPSLSGKSIDSDINVISHIVLKIEESKKKEVDKYEEMSNNFRLKRPGAYDWWSKWKLDKLKEDFIENCKIYPIISLKIFLHTGDYDDYLYLDDDEDYSDYAKRKKESNTQIVQNIEETLKTLLTSYLGSIGYYSSTFEFKRGGYGMFGGYDGNDIVNIDIKINL
jgi:hypothetical protein